VPEGSVQILIKVVRIGLIEEILYLCIFGLFFFKWLNGFSVGAFFCFPIELFEYFFS